jgi:hypothetical protein
MLRAVARGAEVAALFCPNKGSFNNPPKRRDAVMKFLALAFAVASVLLVAPIIESGTPVSTQLFVAIGNADGGGGE